MMLVRDQKSNPASLSGLMSARRRTVSMSRQARARFGAIKQLNPFFKNLGQITVRYQSAISKHRERGTEEQGRGNEGRNRDEERRRGT